MTTNETPVTDTPDEKIQQLEHDLWIAEVMLATVLATTGPVTITKKDASSDYTDYGIDITESEDGEALTLMIKKGK